MEKNLCPKMYLDLDGMEVEFAVYGYAESPNGIYDSKWCCIDLKIVSTDVINYHTKSEMLLSIEIDELVNYINNFLLSEEKIRKEHTFYEPDLEFLFECGCDTFGRVWRSAEWKVFLYVDGYTTNCINMYLDEKDLVLLRDYLMLISGKKVIDSEDVTRWISMGNIVIK